jgi:hypothetical protein
MLVSLLTASRYDSENLVYRHSRRKGDSESDKNEWRNQKVVDVNHARILQQEQHGSDQE